MACVYGERCTACGKCCWNYKTGDPNTKCDYLDIDLWTCTIYANREEMGFGSCVDFPADPSIGVDLPDECGYLTYWKSQGLFPPPETQAVETNEEETEG